MKVACVIIYYNDIDMLINQVKHNLYEIYDVVYIIDGPYKYSNKIKISMDQETKLDETNFGKELFKNKKFKYVYKIWTDKLEKRIFSYEYVENYDVIILHDTDEFYDLEIDDIRDFYYSNYSVGSFYCQNLYLNGVGYSIPFYATSKLNLLPHKSFAFKKNSINASEHINYLWLVGVSQKEIDLKNLCPVPICNGYHFTGMRSRDG